MSVDNSDDSEAERCGKQLPLWRMDPEKSRSDWTLEIIHDDRKDLYYVHQCILVAGPHRSKLLTDLLSTEPRGLRTDSFKLKSFAAEVFPQFLDLSYSPADNWPRSRIITPKNAIALLHLCDYFDARSLSLKITEFISRNLSLKTASIYCQHAVNHGQQLMLDAVAKFLAGNILRIEETSPIVQNMDVKLLLQVMELWKVRNFDVVHPNVHETNLHLSKVVTHFCMTHAVSAQDFDSLTAGEILPRLDFSVCQTLLELETSIAGKEKHVLSPLKTLCFQTLEENYDKIDFENPDSILVAFLQQYPSYMTVKIFTSAIRNYKAQLPPYMRLPMGRNTNGGQRPGGRGYGGW